jgi:hypothetical protein
MTTTSASFPVFKTNHVNEAELVILRDQLLRSGVEITAFRAENERLAAELDLMRCTVDLLCGHGVVWKIAHRCASLKLVAQQLRARLLGRIHRIRWIAAKWTRKLHGP